MDLQDRLKLVDLLFPGNKFKIISVEEIEKRFPERNLPSGAIVNRVAPSPTGFMHIGGLFMSLINRRLAEQTNGRFILRIEDTDVERTIPGAIDTIINALALYKLSPDEGIRMQPGGGFREEGAYGPYLQTSRADLYQSFAAEMVRRDLAYPCFATSEEIEAIREQQRLQKIRTGIYGRFSRWRSMGLAEILPELEKGTPFVIRLKSQGDANKRATWEDGVRGKMSMPENDVDHVLLKSDFLPVYHLAVVVDDHLMRITHVLRGEEWLSSVPLHLQLYEMLGWKPPHFSHASPIMKLDKITVLDEATGQEIVKEGKRKLSKRKDPEANVFYYVEAGFPEESLLEYLLNIANSDFEDWRKANPFKSLSEFNVRVEKLSPSGALSDTVKLTSISKEVIARMSVDDIYLKGLKWAQKSDSDLAKHMIAAEDYTKAALNIERSGPKIAKRIATWQDLRSQLWFFYDDYFAAHQDFLWSESLSIDLRKQSLAAYLAQYNPEDDKTVWFDRCKVLAKSLGFADNMKDYKANPQNYKGNVGDLTGLIRMALCGVSQSPDLWEVQRVLGLARVNSRISRWL